MLAESVQNGQGLQTNEYICKSQKTKTFLGILCFSRLGYVCVCDFF